MNVTESSMEFLRQTIFIWATTQTIATICANVTLLVFSYKIPDQIRNPLHVLYTILGVADLVNGVTCSISSVAYYFVDISFFRSYNVCFSLMMLNNTGFTTTGYTLLLLALMKCISIMFPLKSLRFITRRSVFISSVGIWVFSYLIIICPSVYWNIEKFHGIVDQCNMKNVYGAHHKKFAILGFTIGVLFTVCFLTVNIATVLSIARQRRRVGDMPSDPDKSKYDEQPSMMKIELNRESLGKNTVTETQPTCLTSTQSNHSATKKQPEPRKQQRKKPYDLRKSKNFKAYITVLLHVLTYSVCGLPVAILAGSKKFSTYYYNDRNARYLVHLFMFLTSLVNPLLTLFRIPVFKQSAKNIVGKIRRKFRNYFL